jgi:Xaa-Pro dipeptidase
MSLTRLNRLAQSLANTDQQAVVLNPGPSLAYLMGVQFFLYERPIVAFFTPNQPPALVLPELEIPKAQTASIELEMFPYSDNPATWTEAFARAARFLGWGTQSAPQVGVEPERLRLLELRLLQAAIPGIRLADAEVLVAMRMHKDEAEIACLRRAVAIAEAGLEAALPLVQIGMSERQLSEEIGAQVQRAGSQAPSNPMVESGPNSANPHATVSDRPLAPGDALVIDFGALYQGYCADITRTFAVAEASPELETIARLAAEANAAGRAAARPGLPAGQVDRAARAVIQQAGYGPYFTHRTGHGLGSEPHEPPYIYAENQQPLEPGMVFTVEPGIYLPGRAGARVEDDVLVTAEGLETLSSLPRHLRVVG